MQITNLMKRAFLFSTVATTVWYLVLTLSISFQFPELIFFIFKVGGLMLIGSPSAWQAHGVGSEAGARRREAARWAASRPWSRG